MSDVTAEAALDVTPVLETPTVGNLPKPKASEDDVIEAMKDVVLTGPGLRLVAGGRGLQHRRHVERGFCGHVAHDASFSVVATACAVASFQAIQPSSAHFTRAG